jgi:hypothetical protein
MGGGKIMGSLQAQEMAEMLDIDSALAWHLQSNHYPPVPLTMVEACKEAIQNALEGKWLEPVLLPDPVKYRGSSYAPTSAIIEQHHLDAWLELDEEGLE